MSRRSHTEANDVLNEGERFEDDESHSQEDDSKRRGTSPILKRRKHSTDDEDDEDQKSVESNRESARVSEDGERSPIDTDAHGSDKDIAADDVEDDVVPFHDTQGVEVGVSKKKKNRMFVAKEIMLENKFIVSRMKKAYMDDIECMMQQTPALNRIHLLPRVISVLKRQYFLDELVNSLKVLDAIALWLMPLPDKSLPPLDLRTSLFHALYELPVFGEGIEGLDSEIETFEGITEKNLSESPIGKIIHLFSHHPQETLENRRVCRLLKEKWSRMILSLSSSIRSLHDTSKLSAIQNRPNAKRRSRIEGLERHMNRLQSSSRKPPQANVVS